MIKRSGAPMHACAAQSAQLAAATLETKSSREPAAAS